MDRPDLDPAQLKSELSDIASSVSWFMLSSGCLVHLLGIVSCVYVLAAMGNSGGGIIGPLVLVWLLLLWLGRRLCLRHFTPRLRQQFERAFPPSSIRRTRALSLLAWCDSVEKCGEGSGDILLVRRALSGDPEFHVRCILAAPGLPDDAEIDVMAGMGSRALEALATALRDENELYQLRCTAARCLGRIGSVAAQVALLEALVVGKVDRPVRNCIGEALDEAGWHGTSPRTRAEVNVLLGRYAAAAAEGRVAVRPLAKAFLDAGIPDRAACGAELRKILGVESAVEVFRRTLRHTDRGVRVESVRQLSALGSDLAVPVLQELLAGPDPDCRAHAIEALLKMGSPRAKKAVVAASVACLRGEGAGFDEKMASARALRGAVGDGASTDCFVSLFLNGGPVTRSVAMRNLRELGGKLQRGEEVATTDRGHAFSLVACGQAARAIEFGDIGIEAMLDMVGELEGAPLEGTVGQLGPVQAHSF